MAFENNESALRQSDEERRWQHRELQGPRGSEAGHVGPRDVNPISKNGFSERQSTGVISPVSFQLKKNKSYLHVLCSCTCTHTHSVPTWHRIIFGIP